MSKSNCSSCKKTPLIKYEGKLFIFATYLLTTSIYGTIVLIQKIISLL